MSRFANNPQFEGFILKRFPRWTLSLDDRQFNLGEATIRLVRKDRTGRLTEISAVERDELFVIQHQYVRVIDGLWKPDDYDCMWRGRERGTLRIVPRYEETRTVFNNVFVDKGAWQHASVVAKVLDALRHELNPLVPAGEFANAYVR